MMPSVVELRRDFMFRGVGAAPIVRLPEGGAEEHGWSLSEAVRILRELGPAVVAIGAFDGLHRGHHELIQHALNDARWQGVAAVAVTFDPDPDTVVAPHPAPRLMTAADRHAMLAASGVDAVMVVPFTPELAGLDFESFLSSVLLAACEVRAIHVGSNFRLGRGGAATVANLGDWGKAHDVAVHGHRLVLDGADPISSTRIRGLLATGDLASAQDELGRRYLLRGRVGFGRGEGTGMGFPTANIVVDPCLQVPAEGVYSGLALIDGIVWPAAINVGVPPTFSDQPQSASLEANLLGFTGDIYGDDLSLVFAKRLRGLIAFDSVDDLIATVLDNIETVRNTFGEKGVPLA